MLLFHCFLQEGKRGGVGVGVGVENSFPLNSKQLLTPVSKYPTRLIANTFYFASKRNLNGKRIPVMKCK
jgi:hypothetical protein